MVVYPVKDQEIYNQIVKSYPWSRVQLRPIRFQGYDYNQVISSDINLMKEIYDKFPINQEEIIKSM